MRLKRSDAFTVVFYRLYICSTLSRTEQEAYALSQYQIAIDSSLAFLERWDLAFFWRCFLCLRGLPHRQLKYLTLECSVAG